MGYVFERDFDQEVELEAETEARRRVEAVRSDAAGLADTAEAEARDRVATALAEGQERLDEMQAREEAVRTRLRDAETRLRAVVESVFADDDTQVDLTGDDPVVVVGRVSEHGVA